MTYRLLVWSAVLTVWFGLLAVMAAVADGLERIRVWRNARQARQEVRRPYDQDADR